MMLLLNSIEAFTPDRDKNTTYILLQMNTIVKKRAEAIPLLPSVQVVPS
jgi:hypothetical protein